MARIPKGTDSAGNVLPDGRFTIGLSDGSELTGSQGVITSGPDEDTVVITTRLSRRPRHGDGQLAGGRDFSSAGGRRTDAAQWQDADDWQDP